MKYLVTYAYDLPHTADFVIEARNKKDALKKAKQALSAGCFDAVTGDPDDTGYNDRVYVGQACAASEASAYEDLTLVRANIEPLDDGV